MLDDVAVVDRSPAFDMEQSFLYSFSYFAKQSFHVKDYSSRGREKTRNFFCLLFENVLGINFDPSTALSNDLNSFR